MDFSKFENSSFFKRLVRTVDTGDYLFRQGQRGNTMYIILQGQLELLAERDGEDHLIAVMQAGQFLGEKAMVKDTPYQRAFSARAMTSVSALELSVKELSVIQKEAPELMINVMKKSFEVAAERLDRANYLIRILRSSDNLRRLCDCIQYLCHTTGEKSVEGVRVPLTVDNIYYYIDMDRKQIESCLKRLVAKKLLIPAGDDHYTIPDETALFAYFEEMRTAIAA
jgi:CRP/FNR family transcriptional regulator, cyclic AMP receptor protein